MSRQKGGIHDAEIDHGEIVEPLAELQLVVEQAQLHLVIQGIGKFGGELARLLLRIDRRLRPERLRSSSGRLRRWPEHSPRGTGI